MTELYDGRDVVTVDASAGSLKSGSTFLAWMRTVFAKGGVAELSGYAAAADAALTGTPVAPTATAGTNTTQVATTAFVSTAVGAKANLASPTFTGTPAAPTATAGTDTTQVATTSFVTTAVAAVITAATTLAGRVTTLEGAPMSNTYTITDGDAARNYPGTATAVGAGDYVIWNTVNRTTAPTNMAAGDTWNNYHT